MTMPLTDQADLPQFTTLDDLFDLMINGVVAHREYLIESHSRILDCLNHTIALCESGGHGFLTHDVFTRLSRRNRKFGVLAIL